MVRRVDRLLVQSGYSVDGYSFVEDDPLDHRLLMVPSWTAPALRLTLWLRWRWRSLRNRATYPFLRRHQHTWGLVWRYAMEEAIRCEVSGGCNEL